MNKKMKIIKYVGVGIEIVLIVLIYLFLPVAILTKSQKSFYVSMSDFVKNPIISVNEDPLCAYCEKPYLALWGCIILCVGLLIVLFATKSAFFVNLITNVTSFIIFCIYKNYIGKSGGASGFTISFERGAWIFIVFAFLVAITIFSAFICFYKPKEKTELSKIQPQEQ